MYYKIVFFPEKYTKKKMHSQMQILLFERAFLLH